MNPIAGIIPRMWRRLISALLVIGWISLSGFDVVEDLDEVPGRAAVSSSSPDENTLGKRGGWGHLANNMVESANPSQRTDATNVRFSPTIFKFEPVSDLRRHFQLHKLYRVFLI
jgi:hypothetical protein